MKWRHGVGKSRDGLPIREGGCVWGLLKKINLLVCVLQRRRGDVMIDNVLGSGLWQWVLKMSLTFMMI